MLTEWQSHALETTLLFGALVSTLINVSILIDKAVDKDTDPSTRVVGISLFTSMAWAAFYFVCNQQ